MKNKNGFTLIELIASMALLAILSTILITFSIRRVNEVKESGRETLIKSIELATENYVRDYNDELVEFKNNDYIFVKLETLVEKEYFTKSLIDPTTKNPLPLSDTAYVTREYNGKIKVKYDINQKINPKLILNGSYNMYIKKNTQFNDPGVVITKSDGTNVSSSVVITGIVDTSKIGNYKITYQYDNSIIYRNVIVYDTN